jgi:hypothetical protein
MQWITRWLTLMAMIIRIGSFRTIHGVSRAVQIVRMEPLVILADRNASPITIADRNLLISPVGTLLSA